MKRALLTTLLLAAAPASAESPFGTPVPDAELANMRGGIALPNGIDVSIAVRTETSVDGNLLLRSVYALANGPATLQLFAPAPGHNVKTGGGEASASSGGGDAGEVWVMFDRDNGATINARSGVPAGVTVTSGPAPSSTSDDGLSPLPIGPGGSIETAGGRVTLQELPAGARARIEGEKIDVSHIFGSAFGSVVANSGSDRAIDTMTVVSIDLRGATPDNLGSSVLQADALALDATRALAAR